MAGSVYEHLSPVIEGFTGNMQTVFSQLLKINDPDRAANKIAFLKTAINEQRVLADSLMESSKKMGPVSQKLSADTRAYQAAFETDIITPQPQTGSTLQGFTLIFFIISFFSILTVWIAFNVYALHNKASKEIYMSNGDANALIDIALPKYQRQELINRLNG